MYSGRPEEACKTLIADLQRGMSELMHLKGNSENFDPNIAAFAVSSLSQMRAQHNVSMHSTMEERDTKSIHSGVSYNQSAIGEMNQGELDQLLAINEKRIEEIKNQYFEKRDKIKSYHDVMIE